MFCKISLCPEKYFSVLANFVVFSQRLLCSGKDCCVLEKSVVFSKRLLCSRKACCVSEDKLSCVLPLWATVAQRAFDSFTVLPLINKVDYDFIIIIII